jgi:3-oxoacyl-[acyl-carrier protein] reductase
MRRVALVTGGSRGIGRGIAEALAENKYDIAVTGRVRPEKEDGVMGSCLEKGVKAIFIQADISLSQARKTIVHTIKSEFGRLDLLVNNAGVAPEVRSDILNAGEDSYDRVMNINLKGPYFLTQMVANWMIEQKKSDDKRHLSIINISSISAYTSSPSRGEYCISKAGMSMMTKLYADRLSEYGIGVYEIRPGIIKTDMTAAVQEKYDKQIAEGLLPCKRWGTPADVANVVLAIAAGRFAYSTGQVINVDGGFHLRRL